MSSEPEADNPQSPNGTAGKPSREAANVSIGRGEAAEIVALCVAGGVPAMAAGLIGEGVAIEEVKARIRAAGEGHKLVALGRRQNKTIPADLADKVLAEGGSVEDIRSRIFDILVTREQETSVASHIPASIGNAGFAASAANMEQTLQAQGIEPLEGSGR